MRKVLIILAVIMIASCKLTPIWTVDDFSGNPFSEAYDLTRRGHVISGEVRGGVLEAEPVSITVDVPDVIRIPLITDAHVGRDDSGTAEYHDAFISFLQDGDYPFLIDLGDLVDQGNFTNPDVVSFYKATADLVNGNHLYVIGNHELHDETSSSFDRFLSAVYPDRNNARMIRFTFGPLSIYMLDNSHGVFGRRQLECLESTLREDVNPYKIFITHVNVATGRKGDQSFIITGMSDEREVHRIMRLMDEYGVSLILSGHHHKGDIEYHFTKNTGEFNAAAFHRRDSFLDFESRGYFYLLELDTTENEIRIIQHSSETGETTGRVFSFEA